MEKNLQTITRKKNTKFATKISYFQLIRMKYDFLMVLFLFINCKFYIILTMCRSCLKHKTSKSFSQKKKSRNSICQIQIFRFCGKWFSGLRFWVLEKEKLFLFVDYKCGIIFLKPNQQNGFRYYVKVPRITDKTLLIFYIEIDIL